MVDIKTLLNGSSGSTYYLFIQILLITGFGLKAALMPFHAWLPDAHASAPSPISAMLSGVLIKAVGVYVLIRLFFNMFEVSADMAIVITVLGSVSMVVGALVAFRQWDLKRMLAYSSISQIGYVMLAIGMGMILITRNADPDIIILAIGGALYHLINHAVFKGLLFLNAGALEYRLDTRDLKEMGGMARTMPATSATSFMASMSISGLPPFNGFFSKLIIIIAAIYGEFYFLAILAILVSIITLAYFLKFQRYAFFNKGIRHDVDIIKEAPFTMVFSMITLSILCIALSIIAIPGLREQILGPAVEILIHSDLYSLAIPGL